MCADVSIEDSFFAQTKAEYILAVSQDILRFAIPRELPTQILKDMDKEDKHMTQEARAYEPPKIELLKLQRPLHLLARLSTTGSFEDYELGDEL